MDAEALERLAICGRLFDAWPNARPPNRDRTLIEYVNATRTVLLGDLPRAIQHAIDAGGDFLPPAGEILRRSIGHELGGQPVGTDRDEQFWFQRRLRDALERHRQRADRVPRLDPDRSIESNTRPMIEAGDVLRAEGE